mmetsp:Transcript_4825/g.10785  ORF Transcript_4825/g.10785 Transcript_4825/m.10785 type:complete len:235 (+) Transcript_4825:167-871(+)
MHSCIAAIIFGLPCAFIMSSMTFGFFISSCAFPMASPPMPPMPPIPPMPPMFFSMSPMPPIPPMPPMSPKGLLPPGCCCCRLSSVSDRFGLGPEESSVRTSTFVYSAYPSSAFFPTPSTRASASALTKSVFSKKDFVEIPIPSSSFFRSPTFMALHFSSSSASRSSRGLASSSFSLDDDDESSLRFFFFLGGSVDADAVVVLAAGSFGLRPSALAFSNAFTNSDFSMNATVEMP